MNTERQIRNLNALLELSKSLASEVQVDNLLQVIVHKTTEVMEADRSSLFIFDEVRNELWSKIAEGVELKEIRFPVGVGIAGDVAKTRKGANIPDAYEDSRFNPTWDRKTGYRTRSVLCLPITSTDGKLIAVVQVLNKKTGPVFDEQDENLLAALGAHVAVALERARLIAAYVEKQRLEETLKLAQKIQLSLLPRRSPDVKYFDLAAWSIPCDETGGDYYDYIEMPDGRLGIVIGDVSGHGLGAAMFMATARASLRSILMNLTEPAKVLHQLNNRLVADMHEEAFMTLFFGILEPSTRTFRYTSAGHESPILYRDHEDRCEQLESTGLPLGMIDDMEFPEGPTTLFNEGDILLLTTDGVFEAMNEQEEQLGHARMVQVLRECRGQPAEAITQEMRRRTYEFIGSAHPRDDISIVTIKALRTPPREAGPEETLELLEIEEAVNAPAAEHAAGEAAGQGLKVLPAEES
ncbi:MAG: SpoIIE family protein phosphatase [Planctomycetes bacterium]|nr:SpoIIE family protein phosphatase [Planctomycetota bacterium]